jgi:hypothetical protein
VVVLAAGCQDASCGCLRLKSRAITGLVQAGSGGWEVTNYLVHSHAAAGTT